MFFLQRFFCEIFHEFRQFAHKFRVCLQKNVEKSRFCESQARTTGPHNSTAYHWHTASQSTCARILIGSVNLLACCISWSCPPSCSYAHGVLYTATVLHDCLRLAQVTCTSELRRTCFSHPIPCPSNLITSTPMLVQLKSSYFGISSSNELDVCGGQQWQIFFRSGSRKGGRASSSSQHQSTSCSRPCSPWRRCSSPETVTRAGTVIAGSVVNDPKRFFLRWISTIKKTGLSHLKKN